MALLKQVALPTGVNADYWKVASYNVNNVSHEALVEIHLFLNQQARQENAQAIFATSVIITAENYEQLFAEIILAEEGKTMLKAIYAFLKQLEQFSGAVDA